MSKKAQGLSLNMIIIAVIALIVLVVVVAIFSGKMRFFHKGVQSCASQSGHCSCFSEVIDGKVSWDTSSDCKESNRGCPDGWGPIEGTDCNNDKKTNNELCCIKVF